jgi:hypothetical protein
MCRHTDKNAQKDICSFIFHLSGSIFVNFRQFGSVYMCVISTILSKNMLNYQNGKLYIFILH